MYEEELGKRGGKWVENDPSFIPEGAKAFKRDVPNAEIHFVPGGHFALESHHTEIAILIKDFLATILSRAV